VLVYHLTHCRITRTLTTAYRLSPHEWDESSQSVIIAKDIPAERARTLAYIQRNIRRGFREIYREIEACEARGEYTTEQIVTQYRKRNRYQTLSSVVCRKIEYLLSINKFGTARCYENALKSFMRFRNKQDIYIAKLDVLTVCKYEQYLKQDGKSLNTISCYMRSLRAAYNDAVRERIIEPKLKDPFADVFTGNAQTPKRAIQKESFKKIDALRLRKGDRRLLLTRDLFMFSFFAQGMAYIDMVSLKKENIRDGYICYKRQKTNQPIKIELLPCMERIIDCYKERTQNSAYVFPVLMGSNSALLWRQYQSGLSLYNRALKRISLLSGLKTLLTSYVARHSWATIACTEGIPLSVISRGMGHESERTTEIYISRVDYSDVNRANKKVISFLEKYKQGLERQQM
jgi:site-specific recombinase XerD